MTFVRDATLVMVDILSSAGFGRCIRRAVSDERPERNSELTFSLAGRTYSGQEIPSGIQWQPRRNSESGVVLGIERIAFYHR